MNDIKLTKEQKEAIKAEKRIERGKRLSELLELYHLQQKDISKSVVPDSPLQETTVSAICTGKRMLTEDKAQFVIDHFFPKVRIQYLLGFDDYMTMENLQNSEIFQKRDSLLEAYETIIKNSLKNIRYLKKGNRIEYCLKRVYDHNIFGDNYELNRGYELSEETRGVAWWEIQNAKTGKTIIKLPFQDLRTFINKIQSYSDGIISEYIDNNKPS